MAAAVASNGASQITALLQGADKPPTVEAKELEGVVLLRRRRGLERLDMAPFALLYALTTMSLLSYAISGQW